MATTAEAMEAMTADRPRPGARRRGRSSFHLVAALTIAASMIAGFSYEIPRYIARPGIHRPAILLVHSVVFVGWLAVYVAQTLLVRTNNVRLHRRLGWLGVALAVIMPPLGIATSLAMRRFDIVAFHSRDVPKDLAFLALLFADMIAFTPCAWLGIALRKRPDYHRRLMYLSTTAIAEVGFGRLPIPGITVWSYLCNLAFFVAGMAHDRRTLGHVHKVYLWAVPLILLDEAVATWLWLAHPAWWVAVCRSLTGLG